MTDHQKRSTNLISLPHQQINKSLLGRRIEGRGRFVGDHQPGLPDQCARGGNPLLLTDAEFGRPRVLNEVWIKP